MTDLRVAHLLVWQPDVLPRAADQQVRVVILQSIPGRFVRAVDGIVLRVIAMTPAIEYD